MHVRNGWESAAFVARRRARDRRLGVRTGRRRTDGRRGVDRGRDSPTIGFMGADHR